MMALTGWGSLLYFSRGLQVGFGAEGERGGLIQPGTAYCF